MDKKWYDLKELEKHHTNHFAQEGEDGLLEYIFDWIDPKSKYAVEFGAGHLSAVGTPNVKWLVDKFEWESLMFEEKNKCNDEHTREKYGIHKESVTYENINELFKKYSVPENIDIVVIDVDGQDYWIWEALNWKPQVVEIEFNTTLDVNESKVMHKDKDHCQWRDKKSSYYGASVTALKKLGKKKGYTLIGRCGRNLFFVLDELVEDGYDVDVNDLGVELVEADKSRASQKNEKWVKV
tara:strand:+ start:217 stop:930 length:714 start_codon:yes stop_codon:yes gene_type:complete